MSSSIGHAKEPLPRPTLATMKPAVLLTYPMARPIAPGQEKPGLERVLGRRDLILLFVVAVANLNLIPAISASGPVTLWLWLLALATYFWPQGAAVTELAQKWPGEGGIYLWAKRSFGEEHGFLAGWCYWLSNVVYLPTVVLSCVGVGVYIAGPAYKNSPTARPSPESPHCSSSSSCWPSTSAASP